MDTTHTRESAEQRPPRPRKIGLDSHVYRPHSVRASAGDADCDHDFESAPTVRQSDFAVWNCTRCGRAFRYEIWNSTPEPARKEIDTAAAPFGRSAGLRRDPAPEQERLIEAKRVGEAGLEQKGQ
jgi:hypothetical protein